MQASKYVVEGLNDAQRIPDIKKSISSHDGINAVRVDMEATTITVDYDDGRYSEKDIARFVNEAGFNVVHIK